MNLILLEASDFTAPDTVVLDGRRLQHVLAVHRAGGGFVPLAVDAPPSRLVAAYVNAPIAAPGVSRKAFRAASGSARRFIGCQVMRGMGCRAARNCAAQRAQVKVSAWARQSAGLQSIGQNLFTETAASGPPHRCGKQPPHRPRPPFELPFHS